MMKNKSINKRAPSTVCHQRCSGQAMTEFVIGAAFVLIPLFLFTSIGGKYADMKYAAVQAARYEAWEYTANYFDTRDQPSGFTRVSSGNMPQKSALQVQRESRRRFFSDTSTGLSSRFDRNGYVPADRNRLWTYHDGSDMYNSLTLSPLSQSNGRGDTPDRWTAGILTTTIGIIDGLSSAFGAMINALGGNARFDAINEKGYASSTVSLPVQPSPNYQYLNSLGGNPSPLLSANNLDFVARAAVLTDSWSAGGTAHTSAQAGGLVPTSLLDVLLNPGGVPVQTIAANVLLSPELGRDSLRFGHPYTAGNVELIPPEKTNSGTHSCTGGGYCEY